MNAKVQPLTWACVGWLVCVSVAVESHPASGFEGPMVEFAPAQAVLDTPAGILDIVLVDLDLDNDLDIVALAALAPPGSTDRFGLIHVLRNDGGSFATSTAQVGPFFALENLVHHLRVGDVTGDQLPDIAFIGSLAPLHLMINLGGATFGTPIDTGVTVDLGTLMGLLDVGDLNGDGLADVAVGLPGQVGISDGSGGLSVQDFSNDVNPRTLSIVDLNGDGLNDIAYGSRTHINNGDGTFSLVGGVGNIPTGGFALDCVFADFDGDSAADVACAGFLSDIVGVALNVGGGIFTAATQHPVSDCPIQIRSGDVNGDQKEDLLVTHARCPDNTNNTAFVSLLTGQGDGGFAPAILIAAHSGRALAVGDMDGDGLDDLVLASGLAFSGPDGIDILFNITRVPGSADIDGNGDLDLVDVELFVGVLIGTNLDPTHAARSDLNGDGDADGRDIAGFIEIIIP